MFMLSGTSVNIWMNCGNASGVPDFGSHIYVDDSGNKYVDDSAQFYEDGEPE
jgi:hypothetical protein